MAKPRTSLVDALRRPAPANTPTPQHDNTPAPAGDTAPAPTGGRRRRPKVDKAHGTRDQAQIVFIRGDAEAQRRCKILSIDTGYPLQDLGIIGLGLVFKALGLPPLDAELDADFAKHKGRKS